MDINEQIEKLRALETKLKETAQGRVYVVGTKIIYKGKFGVVTYLNKGSQDPAGHTVDLRLEDGTIVEGVDVSSTKLEKFRS